MNNFPKRKMNVQLFRVNFFLVLLCVFTEPRPICGPPETSRLTSRDVEKFSVDYTEIFNFFSAIPPSSQKGRSDGNVQNGSTAIESLVENTSALNANQIAEIEQRSKNNPNELQSELRLRLTPDIFGPICLNKMTPETLGDWLMSSRPRIHLWTNDKVVRSLQAEIKAEMRPSGLIVDKSRGYLAALPDGLVGDRTVLKVHVVQSLIKDLELDGGENFLDTELSAETYLYYEIQGLLAITDKEECILVIVSKDVIKPVVIQRNRDFWNYEMVKKIEEVSAKVLLPRPTSDQHLSVRDLHHDTLREKLKELLTCAVCTELIKPPYKVCRNGHLLCHDCFPQLLKTAREQGELPKCPTCRVPIPPKPSRCLAFENISKLIHPEISPDPVIKPDDPMDNSFGSESTETQWDSGRAMTPVFFRNLFRRPSQIISDDEQETFPERSITPPLPYHQLDNGFLPDDQIVPFSRQPSRTLDRPSSPLFSPSAFPSFSRPSSPLLPPPSSPSPNRSSSPLFSSPFSPSPNRSSSPLFSSPSSPSPNRSSSPLFSSPSPPSPNRSSSPLLPPSSSPFSSQSLFPPIFSQISRSGNHSSRRRNRSPAPTQPRDPSSERSFSATLDIESFWSRQGSRTPSPNLFSTRQ